MSEFIDANLTVLCIGFTCVCALIAIAAVLWGADPHEDEEIDAMKRGRK